MTYVLSIADAFRRFLVPFLIGAAIVFAVLLTLLLVQRWVRSLAEARRARFAARYQPIIERVLQGAADARDEFVLRRAARRTPSVIGQLLVAPLSALSGSPVANAAAFAQAAGLDHWWRRESRQRSWWRRTEAVRALGLINDRSAFDVIAAAFDDPHEEVRAAAASAAGRLADVRAAVPLLARLPDESRHQRVRVIDALRQIGRPMATPLLAALRESPQLLPFVVELVPVVCGSLAVEDLLVWTASDSAGVRAAALQALGRIGVDELCYYHALRALGDDDAGVRAMAARALGRSGRDDAAPYLAARLDDDWIVAAESATALGGLREAGRQLLSEHAAGVGQGAGLARQMLWELDHRRAASAAGGA